MKAGGQKRLKKKKKKKKIFKNSTLNKMHKNMKTDKATTKKDDMINNLS